MVDSTLRADGGVGTTFWGEGAAGAGGWARRSANPTLCTPSNTTMRQNWRKYGCLEFFFRNLLVLQLHLVATLLGGAITTPNSWSVWRSP